jgi:hypothetical protein
VQILGAGSVRTRIGRGLLAVVALLGAGLAVGVSGAMASSAACVSPGVYSVSGSTATCTYTTSGSHDFSVPSYVSDVTIAGVGGQGGGGLDNAAGGFGASVSGTFAVNPDDLLSVAVAGNGTAPNPGSGVGGFGGGGDGGAVAYGGSGGGGGASSVSDGPTSLVVAAGGGGAGWGGAGGDAGQPGLGCDGGGAASGDSGGSAGKGTPCGGGDGIAGSPGQGGAGGNAAIASSGGGGGGGGGYAGGGGGAGGAGVGSGGGGGSSYSSDQNAIFATDNTGVPEVVISWTLASPSVSTSQQPASTTVGSSIADKATVSGGSSPTGTVTFNLYNTPTGAGTALFSDTETLSGGSATSTGYTPTATGTDYWVATYNGDSNNVSVTSTSNVEPVVIAKATPSISTTQQPASTTFGNSIADKATVSGGDSPSGTVTFNLYSNSAGTGTALFTDTETLSGGTATSKSYTPTAAGTDYWVAIYNGDANNNGVTGVTNVEPVSITKAPSSLKAAPQLVLFEPFVGIGNQVVQATLTSGGSPLVGQTVYFSDGSTQLCHATTNAKGVARCAISSFDQALVNRNNQYTATFTATTNYSGSSSTVPAITFFL